MFQAGEGYPPAIGVFDRWTGSANNFDSLIVVDCQIIRAVVSLGIGG